MAAYTINPDPMAYVDILSNLHMFDLCKTNCDITNIVFKIIK